MNKSRCKNCNLILENKRKGALFCCDACRKEFNRTSHHFKEVLSDAAPRTREPRICACEGCFVPLPWQKKKNAIYCSDSCRNKQNHIKNAASERKRTKMRNQDVIELNNFLTEAFASLTTDAEREDFIRRILRMKDSKKEGDSIYTNPVVYRRWLTNPFFTNGRIAEAKYLKCGNYLVSIIAAYCRFRFDETINLLHPNSEPQNTAEWFYQKPPARFEALYPEPQEEAPAAPVVAHIGPDAARRAEIKANQAAMKAVAEARAAGTYVAPVIAVDPNRPWRFDD